MFQLPEAKSLSQRAYTVNKNPLFLFTGAAIVILLTVGLYIIPNVKALNNTKEQIIVFQGKNKLLEDQIAEKEKNHERVADELSLFEEKYRPRLQEAFPDEENIPELTRFLEDFSLQLEQTGHISLNNISYGTSTHEGNYSILPVRLSFEANNVNFVRFMQMIKSSGSIDEKDFYEGKPVRLMRVERMSVSIPKLTEGNEEDQIYSVNMEISAFYRGKKS